MLSPTEPQEQGISGQQKNKPLESYRHRRWFMRGFWFVMIIAAIIVAIFFLKPGLSILGNGQITGPRTKQQESIAVGAQFVNIGDIPITVQALGTVTPLATVIARTRIAGQLTRVAFTEGQQINKGDLVVQVDPRPYQLALEQAKNQLLHDQAQLSNAKIDLSRYETLVNQKAVSQQLYDTQSATVRQLEATVGASEAAVRTAELNLEYTSTIAPITGRAGLRQIDEGNYVQTSDPNGLVTITQMKPISVLFSIPEDQLPPINQRLSSGAALPVVLYDRNRINKLAEGKLSTIDNQIDVNTGTIRLRAIFDNNNQALFPNQFVNVELLVNTVKNATVIPVTARLNGAPGTFVWLIDKSSKTVSIRPIKTGVASVDKVAVLSGLQAGDLVVTDGSDRLREGMPVQISNNLIEPTPTESDRTTPSTAKPP